MGLEYRNTRPVSHKNEANAAENYKYFNDNLHHIPDFMGVKVHNGRWERLVNPETNMPENLWTVTEPVYVEFSWTDIKNNKFGFPLSFHIPSEEFEKKLYRIIKLEKK